MKTSWRMHRPHALANLAFRLVAGAGFCVGLLYALRHRTPGTPSCDIEKGVCIARLIRYEAIWHLAPPVAGLLAGALLGSWLATRVHRYYRSARTA
jgi:hypothetical protein